MPLRLTFLARQKRQTRSWAESVLDDFDDDRSASLDSLELAAFVRSLACESNDCPEKRSALVNQMTTESAHLTLTHLKRTLDWLMTHHGTEELSSSAVARAWVDAGGSHKLCPFAVARVESINARRDCQSGRFTATPGRDALGLWMLTTSQRKELGIDAECALSCACSTAGMATRSTAVKGGADDLLRRPNALRVTVDGIVAGQRACAELTSPRIVAGNIVRALKDIAWLSTTSALALTRLVWRLCCGALLLAWTIVAWVTAFTFRSVSWAVCTGFGIMRAICVVVVGFWRAIILCSAISFAVAQIASAWRRSSLGRKSLFYVPKQQQKQKHLEWKDEYGNWNRYARSDMVHIQRSLARHGASATVVLMASNGQQYELNFAKMTQTNRKYGTERQVRWSASGSPAPPVPSGAQAHAAADASARSVTPPYEMQAPLPDLWKPFAKKFTKITANEPFMRFVCPTSCPAYMFAAKHFRRTCPRRTLLRVELCVNLMRYDAYCMKKGVMNRGIASGANEQIVFHGTDEDTIGKICANGFDRSFSTTAAYGTGTYFAHRAKYSADPRYSKPNARGEKRMLICRILAGESCLGTPTMQRPHAKPSGVLHESMTNDLSLTATPKIYVLSSGTDDCAYPEYLVTFT